MLNDSFLSEILDEVAISVSVQSMILRDFSKNINDPGSEVLFFSLSREQSSYNLHTKHDKVVA